MQLLVVPTPRFSARFDADIQPRGSETTNGRTINLPTPTTYANGTATNLTTDPSTRLARRWFTQNSTYSYAGNYLYGGADGKSVANDAARGLVTGSRGVSTELNWTLGKHTLTSITAYKTYHFNAVNDEGTPFDIQRNSGGFFNDYTQASEEVRMSSPRGRLLDYQAGLFYIDVKNDVDYQKIWGHDAGAWYANPTQYTRLDADPIGRYLLQQSLDGLSMSWNSPTGTQHIRNTSGAPFAQANWRLTPDAHRDHRRTSELRESPEHRQHVHPRQRLRARAEPGRRSTAWRWVASTPPAPARSRRPTPLDQLALADRTANKYFGATITGVAGAAYNGLTARPEAAGRRRQGDPRRANRGRVRSAGCRGLRRHAAVVRGQPAVQDQRPPEHLCVVAVRGESRHRPVRQRRVQSGERREERLV